MENILYHPLNLTGGIHVSNTKTVVKRKRGDWQIAVLFLLPSLILLGLFVFWPMIDSIRMSFYDWNPLKGKIFTGLENYQNLLKDKLWWTSLGNTIKYILMNVPPIVIFSFIQSANLCCLQIIKVKLFRNLSEAVSFYHVHFLWLQLVLHGDI